LFLDPTWSMHKKIYSAAALIVALAACDGGGTTQPQPHDAAVAGKWLYRGANAECGNSLVLHITQSGSTLSAQVPPVGTPKCLPPGFGSGSDSSATFTGRVKGDSVTFTVHAFGADIVHTGVISGDSISGTYTGAPWAAPGTATPFSLRRYTTQVLPQRFMLALSGTVTDTVEGIARSDQYGPRFVYDDETSAGRLTKGVNVGGFPSVPGTYTIYDASTARDSLTGGVSYHGTFYRFSGGTATITSAANGFVQGTLEADAYSLDDHAKTLHVRGGFYASYN
jgi:hypothetical protein